MEQNYVSFGTGEVDIGSKQDSLWDKHGGCGNVDFWVARHSALQMEMDRVPMIG